MIRDKMCGRKALEIQKTIWRKLRKAFEKFAKGFAKFCYDLAHFCALINGKVLLR